MKKKTRLLIVSICTLLIFNIIIVNMPPALASPALTLTATTDKQSYFLREKVDVYANLTSNGSPVQDALVALAVGDPTSLIVARTLQTSTPPPTGDIAIVNVVPGEVDGFQFIPKENFEIGALVYFNITLRNDGTEPKTVEIYVNAYDGNMVPLPNIPRSEFPLSPGIHPDTFRAPIFIPTWAYIGTATVYVSIFTDSPVSGGTPYCPEKNASFQITRGASAGLTNPQTNSNEEYSSTFRLTAAPNPGTFTVYTSASHNGEEATDSTTFQVEDSSYPPQASFIYLPPTPYVGQSITFDASASTAEGYNDTIVSYEWDFDDGDIAKVVRFRSVEKYVDYYPPLGYTDSDPIYEDINQTEPNRVDPGDLRLLPPFGYPPNSTVAPNDTDVGNTLKQFIDEGHRENILENGKYDNGETVYSDRRIITHTYTDSGTFTVTLNVTDTEGLWCTTSKPVPVEWPYGPTANFTYSPDEPFVNGTTTFDATLSEPGWKGTTMPIGTYKWNFGDGTPLVTETDPTIVHVYEAEGNFTVTLNVTDEQGLSDTTSLNITVIELTVVHDLLILNVSPSASVGYPCWTYPLNINVTVRNNGTASETFDVTVYYNDTAIETQHVTDLYGNENLTLTFAWNLSSVPVGTYLISANISSPVLGEIKKDDDYVEIGVSGDVNGDGKLTGADIGKMDLIYSGAITDPILVARADINGDGKVTGGDVGKLDLIYSGFL